MRSDGNESHPPEPFSNFTPPPEQRLGAWKELWMTSESPSIAQLAQHRARHLDLSPVSNRFTEDADVRLARGVEKQPADSMLPSSNASDIFIEASFQVPTGNSTSISRTREIALIFITCMSQFLSLCAMNQTVAPVLVLADYFGVQDYGTLSWFSAAYSMSVGTFILPAGRLGDMYGHKRIYLIGWVWFGVWSLISGFSYKSNHILFSVCRAFQGIGPALLVPNAVALIGRTLPVGHKRMIGFACFGASGPLGATAGAVFSALLADLAWWPWCFWILAIVCSITMGLAFLILPDEHAGVSLTSGQDLAPQGFDWYGTITGVSGLVLINFALNQAPLVTWVNPYIGTLLGVGILFMVAFVLVEMYATNYPLIPIRGLGTDAIFALTCIAVGWASHGIWAYYLYLFLEHLRGHSALHTAAETSPVAITGVFFAFSTVWLIKRFGVSYVMLISMTFFMVGSLLIVTMPLHQTYWAQTFISLLIMPGAMNLSYPAANILLSSALPKEKQGIAASLVSTMVNYSISCGLGFAGTVHRYTLQHEAHKIGQGHGQPPSLSERSSEATAIRLVGLRAAYWFSVALGGFGMLVAFIFVLVTARRKVSEK